MPDFDLAIVGSGFGGSLLAMIARRLGRSVILLEKDSHPRMAIGESSTPLANLMLEELTIRYGLPALTPFSKWGSWQRHYPEIACGLKRGFSFFHHELGRPSAALADRSRQLLVAASPHDAIADTHWFRADFDAFFVKEAQRLGVEYVDHAGLEGVEFSKDKVRIRGKRSVTAGMIVDATGPRGFLHRALGLEEAVLPGFPETEATYNHFTDVGRLDGGSCPFPVNDAAVHHVFDGGWIWVLQFNNGVTSAGVAGRRGFIWKRLIEQIPELEAQFSQARALQEFKHIPRLPFRSSKICGHRWALLPSAAGIVDPLLSTGFPLTLLGIGRLAEVIETGAGLEQYAVDTEQDLLAAARLIGALYANMDRFPLFARISLLYFAAVSYAETAKRLGKGHLASSYLLRDHPVFGPASRRLLKRAIPSEILDAIGPIILEAIGPIDVAGLVRNAESSWFPVDAEDLLSSAAKLESSREEIAAMLAQSGFYETNAGLGAESTGLRDANAISTTLATVPTMAKA